MLVCSAHSAWRRGVQGRETGGGGMHGVAGVQEGSCTQEKRSGLAGTTGRGGQRRMRCPPQREVGVEREWGRRPEKRMATRRTPIHAAKPKEYAYGESTVPTTHSTRTRINRHAGRRHPFGTQRHTRLPSALRRGGRGVRGGRSKTRRHARWKRGCGATPTYTHAQHKTSYIRVCVVCTPTSIMMGFFA